MKMLLDLWLRLTRRGYKRWRRFRHWKTLDMVCSIDPSDSPFFSAFARFKPYEDEGRARIGTELSRKSGALETGSIERASLDPPQP